MAINSLSTGFRPGVCTSSTRPTAPYEGQQIYETDTDKLLVWNNSAWKQIPSAATSGAVLQFVQSADATAFISSTSSTYVTTGVTLSITPTTNTSKIVLTYCLQTYVIGASTGLGLQLKRGSTAIVSDIDLCFGLAGGTQIQHTLWGSDSPSTTSATTYTVLFNRSSGSGTAYINASGFGIGRMYAMEISA